MSVLFKALQKAAKDNEQRQAAPPSFDPERLAGSGVIRAGGGRRMNWRIAGIVIAVVFVAAMGVAFYLTSTSSPSLAPPSGPAMALAPPAAPVPAAPAPVATAPVAPAAAITTPPAVPPAQMAQAETKPKPEPAKPEATPEATKVVAPPAAAPPAAPALMANPPTAAKPTPPKPMAAKPMTREPMPQIAADSPTRMLSPPVSVKREQFALAGAGNAVQVRQVSQEAQGNVRSGYTALIRGDYEMALGFYDQALKSEPNSGLAGLGRAAALQKLGRGEEARSAYELLLKRDPTNREALTNLTGIVADRQPGDALKKLLELEHEHPNFSPIVAQIGMTYAKMESFDLALDYLRRAAVMTPDAVMYQFNLAVVLDRMKLREQALAGYRQVLQLMAGRNLPELSRTDIERRVQYLSTVQ